LKIHSTAIIEEGARIADSATIGAYVIVGAQVEIGERCVVKSHAVLEGAVKIGDANIIGQGAVIGTAPQDLAFKSKTRSGVVIGERNVIREHCTIHRGTAEGTNTVVGNDNYLMAGAHLGHNSRVGNKVIVANNCLLGGYVEVADGAFLGGGCVFHQHMRIGRLAITQGRSGFGKDIPPFVIAADVNKVFGLNVVGLRRAGFSKEAREEIKRAFKLLYFSGVNVTQALALARDHEWSDAGREFFDFVAAAKQRGICAYNRSPAIE
jgi:UDP-N-acetylglucosamine acyltransferase